MYYMEPMMSSASLLIVFLLLVCVAVIIALRDKSRHGSAGPPASGRGRITSFRTNPGSRRITGRSNGA